MQGDRVSERSVWTTAILLRTQGMCLRSLSVVALRGRKEGYEPSQSALSLDRSCFP